MADIYKLARPMCGPLHCVLGNFPPIIAMPQKDSSNEHALYFRVRMRRLVSALLYLEAQYNPKDVQPKIEKRDVTQAEIDEATSIITDPEILYIQKLKRVMLAMRAIPFENFTDADAGLIFPIYKDTEVAQRVLVDELR